MIVRTLSPFIEKNSKLSLIHQKLLVYLRQNWKSMKKSVKIIFSIIILIVLLVSIAVANHLKVEEEWFDFKAYGAGEFKEMYNKNAPGFCVLCYIRYNWNYADKEEQ